MSYLSYISKTIMDLTTKYNTRNPFELCDFCGIITHEHYLGPELKGYYMFINNIPNIVINSTLNNQAKIIVCSHELGHHFIDGGTQFSLFHIHDINRHLGESRANLFCADLYISDDEFEEVCEDAANCLENVSALLNIPCWLINCKIEMYNFRHNGCIDIPAKNGNLAENEFDYWK